MSKNSLKNLRKALWATDKELDPKDIGEALRDLYTAFSAVPDFDVISLTATYAPPFYIEYGRVPKVILVGRYSVFQLPSSTSGGAALQWSWTGRGVRVDSIAGLTVGTKYDFTFLVFG